MINGVDEECYAQMASDLGKLANILEEGTAHFLAIRVGDSEMSVYLSPFMKYYWGIQLRVLQNQIEQRHVGSLHYEGFAKV